MPLSEEEQIHESLVPERVHAFPQVDENLLEQVVGLVGILCKHVAHRVDRAFVLPDNVCKLSFVFFHLACFVISGIMTQGLRIKLQNMENISR